MSCVTHAECDPPLSSHRPPLHVRRGMYTIADAERVNALKHMSHATHSRINCGTHAECDPPPSHRPPLHVRRGMYTTSDSERVNALKKMMLSDSNDDTDELQSHSDDVMMMNKNGDIAIRGDSILQRRRRGGGYGGEGGGEAGRGGEGGEGEDECMEGYGGEGSGGERQYLEGEVC